MFTERKKETRGGRNEGRKERRMEETEDKRKEEICKKC